MSKKYTTFAIITLSVFVLAFAFVRNGNFLNDLLPESKASYGKKVKLSKNVRSKRRGDSLEVETDDMKTVKMNESYQNDGVEYRVLSAVSSKKLVNEWTRNIIMMRKFRWMQITIWLVMIHT